MNLDPDKTGYTESETLYNKHVKKHLLPLPNQQGLLIDGPAVCYIYNTQPCNCSSRSGQHYHYDYTYEPQDVLDYLDGLEGGL